MNEKERRSGSENRQRQQVVKVRLSSGELAHVKALVGHGGHSAAAVVRKALMGTPLPRQRRPRADAAAVACLLAELATVRAELGKSGSNLNQIAFQLNADRDTASLPEQLAAALEEHEEALRLLLELRSGCMRALGLEVAGDD